MHQGLICCFAFCILPKVGPQNKWRCKHGLTMCDRHSSAPLQAHKIDTRTFQEAMILPVFGAVKALARWLLGRLGLELRFVLPP